VLLYTHGCCMQLALYGALQTSNVVASSSALALAESNRWQHINACKALTPARLVGSRLWCMLTRMCARVARHQVSVDCLVLPLCIVMCSPCCMSTVLIQLAFFTRCFFPRHSTFAPPVCQLWVPSHDPAGRKHQDAVRPQIPAGCL
jgi:hypothetical protein